jgi:hypothetical protein
MRSEGLSRADAWARLTQLWPHATDANPAFVAHLTELDEA